MGRINIIVKVVLTHSEDVPVKAQIV